MTVPTATSGGFLVPPVTKNYEVQPTPVQRPPTEGAAGQLRTRSRQGLSELSTAQSRASAVV
jgi:hypothetical protein